MKRMKKKLMALVVLACLVITMMPTVAFAEGTATEVATEDQLKAAIAAGGDIVLTADISTDEIIKIEKAVKIDGNGKKITTTGVKKTFEVWNNDIASGVFDVEFVNLKIENKYTAGRCVNPRTGGINLTITDCEFTSTGGGNAQTVNLGGSYTTPINVEITNTTIAAGSAGYAITTFNPVNLTVTDSDLSGYSALYFKGEVDSAGSAGTIATINGGTISHGKGFVGETFGVITFEDNNVTVNVVDSTIEATGVTNSNYHSIHFSYKNYNPHDSDEEPRVEGNKITISGDSKIIVSAEGASLATKDTNNTVVVKEVVSNVEIPEAYIADGYKATKAADKNEWTVACAHKTTEVKDAKAATCTAAGYTGDKVCTVCKATVETGKAIAATGHTYVNGACACGDKIEVKVETEVVDTITKEEVKVEEVKEVTVVEDENTVKAEISVKAETTVIATEVATADDVKETEAVKSGAITEATAEAVKEAVLAGDTVKTEIVVNEVKTELVPTSAQTNIEKAAATVGKNAEVVQYLDVEVVLKAASTGEELGTVNVLKTPIKVTVAIPENLKADNVKYVVIRDHNGVVTKLPTTVNANGTITFETDMFSTYALAVADADATAPKTGDTGMMPAAWVAIIAAAGIAFVAARRRNVVR